jgi:CRP/FNR family transcriptional regulator, cyclic AMP receptor protein
VILERVSLARPDHMVRAGVLLRAAGGCGCAANERMKQQQLLEHQLPRFEAIALHPIMSHALAAAREQVPNCTATGVMPPPRTAPSLLSGLPEHLSASLFTSATPVKLNADEVLFLAGDSGDGCYRVEDGLLKVTMVSRAGSERILAFLGPGAIVGELSIIDGLPRSASVVAVRAAALNFLSRAAFEDFAKRHPEIYKSLVTLIAARLRETDAALAAGSFLPLRGRVACTLLELAHDFGQDVGSGRIVIRQKIGQSDLAAMAGIARENVSRILNDWKRRKLVSRLSGYYCLENKAQLQNEAEL